MRTHEFTAPGLVETIIFLEELGDGTLRVTVAVDETDGDIGDLRAVFFDFADPGLLDGITVPGGDVTDRRIRNDGVDTVGRDASVKGAVANASGKYDIGVEIGTQGMSRDDIQSTTFLIDHASVDRTLHALSGQDFAVWLTSVGTAGGPRDGSLKAGGAATAAAEVATEVTVNPDGSLVLDPTADFDHLAVGESDTITVGYGISDSNGGRDTANVEITVNGADEEIHEHPVSFD